MPFVVCIKIAIATLATPIVEVLPIAGIVTFVSLDEEDSGLTRWTVYGERMVDDRRRMRVSIASVRLPDGVEFEQYVFRIPCAAMALALDSRNRECYSKLHVIEKKNKPWPASYAPPAVASGEPRVPQVRGRRYERYLEHPQSFWGHFPLSLVPLMQRGGSVGFRCGGPLVGPVIWAELFDRRIIHESVVDHGH